MKKTNDLTMNVLLFMIPKVNVEYLYDDVTIRQALEKMEYHRYTSIPVISKKGQYIGTLSEGDLLWWIKNNFDLNMKEAEKQKIKDVNRLHDNLPRDINTNINDLISKSIEQNFVPIVDNKNQFIGIVTRKAIIKYCYEKINNEKNSLD